MKGKGEGRLLRLSVFLMIFLTSSLGVFERLSPSVVLIRTFDKKGSLKGAGTGFFISSKGQLITNNHVIQGAYSAIAVNEEGKVYPIKGLIAKDNNADLVELLADVGSKDVAFLELSKTLPAWGDKALVIGYPGTVELTLSVGKVNAGSENGRISNRCIMYEISAPVSSGSSGSPNIRSKWPCNRGGSILRVPRLL